MELGAIIREVEAIADGTDRWCRDVRVKMYYDWRCQVLDGRILTLHQFNDLGPDEFHRYSFWALGEQFPVHELPSAGRQVSMALQGKRLHFLHSPRQFSSTLQKQMDFWASGQRRVARAMAEVGELVGAVEKQVEILVRDGTYTFDGIPETAWNGADKTFGGIFSGCREEIHGLERIAQTLRGAVKPLRQYAVLALLIGGAYMVYRVYASEVTRLS